MTTLRHFDIADYRRNPGKYKLCCTATVKAHMFTADGADDLQAGEIVAVKYHSEAYNPLYRRHEPIYTISKRGREWGKAFANNLASFVL